MGPRGRRYIDENVGQFRRANGVASAVSGADFESETMVRRCRNQLLFERLVVESQSEIGGADGSRKSAETPAILFQVPRQQVYEPILLERGFRAGARKRALNCRAAPRSIFEARRGMRRMDWDVWVLGGFRRCVGRWRVENTAHGYYCLGGGC